MSREIPPECQVKEIRLQGSENNVSFAQDGRQVLITLPQTQQVKAGSDLQIEVLS